MLSAPVMGDFALARGRESKLLFIKGTKKRLRGERYSSRFSFRFPQCRPSLRLVRLFEPFEYLSCGDRPFRQMRIERAGGDIWRLDQLRSREVLGLSLTRERFRRPCERVLSPWHFK